jgi:hypothetical protein
VIPPDRIIEVAGGFMAAKLLFVASGIGLFEPLADGPLEAEALSKRLHVPAASLRIVADAMVALGFLEHRDGRYANSATADAFLTGRGGADLRPFLRFWNQLSYPRWIELEEAVRTGRGPFGTYDFTEQEQQVFSEGVAAVTRGAAHALAAAYDFGRHRSLLDVGGGTGSFLVEVLDRFPALRGTLYELPSTAAVARQRLSGTPTGARIEIVEGDFLSDPIPSGHDALLLANIVHGLSPARNCELLLKLRQHVAAGAGLLLVDFWTDPTHTQPLFAALMAGEFLLQTGEGASYSHAEAADWLRQTGWSSAEHIPLAGPSSVLVALAE